MVDGRRQRHLDAHPSFASRVLLHGLASPGAAWTAEALSLVGQIWVAALRMTVVPLMIALTLSTILGAPRGASVGALGLRTVAVFAALLGRPCVCVEIEPKLQLELYRWP